MTYLLEQVGQGLKLLKINLLLADYFYREGRKNAFVVFRCEKNLKYSGARNLTEQVTETYPSKILQFSAFQRRSHPLRCEIVIFRFVLSNFCVKRR